jgi:hypothetical protein
MTSQLYVTAHTGHRSLLTGHFRLNGVLRDEGGLLQDIPEGVEYRETLSGTPYLLEQKATSSGELHLSPSCPPLLTVR